MFIGARYVEGPRILRNTSKRRRGVRTLAFQVTVILWCGHVRCRGREACGRDSGENRN